MTMRSLSPLRLLLAVLSLHSLAGASPVHLHQHAKPDYRGTKVFRLGLYDDKDVADAKDIIQNLGLDTWTHAFAINKNVDVVVPKSLLGAFDDKLEQTALTKVVMHEDLHDSIEQESATEEVYDLSDKGGQVLKFSKSRK
jgi:hypothetical protein